MSDRETFLEFLELLKEIRDAVLEDGAVLLVEGERDRNALVGLGLPPQSVLLVHHGVTLSELVEGVVRRGREVILLTDWDPAGGKLAHRIHALLDDGRVKINVSFRRRLARAVRGETRHVEALLPWAERAAVRAGAPLEHWLSQPA